MKFRLWGQLQLFILVNKQAFSLNIVKNDSVYVICSDILKKNESFISIERKPILIQKGFFLFFSLRKE